MGLDLLTTAACTELGYTDDHEKISYCESAVRSFCRHMQDPSLPQIPVGGSAHEYKRAKRARLKELKARMADDVATENGLDSKEAVGLIAGILLLIFGGPIFVVCAVVAAVAEWALEGWLDKKFPPKAYEEACQEALMATAYKSNVRSVWVHFCIQLGWLRHAILH